MMEEQEQDESLHGVDRLRAVRIEKADALRGMGVNPYPYRFEVTHNIAALLAGEAQLVSAETVISTAGRIVAMRGHGKTCFGHIEDSSGRIQFYVRRDDLGEDAFSRFEKMEVGDI